jgi:hypothetical protein
MDDRSPVESAERSNTAAIEARRRILKIGAYAAYTAPILLAMATSAKAQALSQSTTPTKF